MRSLPLLSRAAGLFEQFLRWWLGELAALVPERVRDTLAGRSEALVVDAAGPEVTVSRSAGSRRHELVRVAQPDLAHGNGPAPALPIGRRRIAAAREIVLRLPFEKALRKTVVLPAGAESNLHDILHFELDRQTPFRPEEVYFDHRIHERLANTQRIVVELTVLARAAVDPLLAWLHRAGLEVGRIEGAGPHGDDWHCRLPARRETDAGRRSALARMLNPALVVLALLLAGIAVFVPIMQQERRLEELRARLAAEKQNAEATMALEETLADLGAQASYLIDKKQENAPVLAIWNEVTRIVPDHSFALELRVREGEVELIGQSEAATSLLDVVEDSPMFHKASFRSPITRGRGGDAERFHLAFEVRPPDVEQRAER
jgi:general secretion pathway protein L